MTESSAEPRLTARREPLDLTPYLAPNEPPWQDVFLLDLTIDGAWLRSLVDHVPNVEYAADMRACLAPVGTREGGATCTSP